MVRPQGEAGFQFTDRVEINISEQKAFLNIRNSVHKLRVRKALRVIRRERVHEGCGGRGGVGDGDVESLAHSPVQWN